MNHCQNCQQLQTELTEAKKENETLRKTILKAVSLGNALANEAIRNIQNGNMGKGAWGAYNGQLDTAEAMLKALGSDCPSKQKGLFKTFKGF